MNEDEKKIGSSSHVTTYFRTFVRTYESTMCLGSNIRVKVIVGTRTNLSGA